MSFMGAKTATLLRALIMDGEVSLAVLDTSALVAEAAKRHALAGTPLTILGDTLTAAGYLCGWLKNPKSSLSVSMSGEGGSVCVSGDGELAIRGFIIGCENGLEEGRLTVVRDDGEGLPFSGTVALVSQSTEENFARYFEESEQLPTGVALYTECTEEGVRAGGVFLQPLPNASQGTLKRLREETNACRELLYNGQTEKIFSRYGVSAIKTLYPAFKCRCSLKKAERAVISMGKSEAIEVCRQEGALRVHCDYCNTDYAFDEKQILKLFSEDSHER